MTWLRDPIKSHWTGARILDELEDRGYRGGRTVLMDYLRRVRPKPVAQAEARFHVKPGQQVQIDWAEMGPVSVAGVMIKVYVFVAILAWSRTLFVFFGGVPREVLIDNLKTGVDSRAGGTIRWNAHYEELAVALGFNPMAHFPLRPKTKGRVERIVAYVRGRFFIGRDVVDLDHLNGEAMDWLEKRANRRVHRVTAERPCDRLTTERASLKPLAQYDIKLEENRVADAYGRVSCDGVRYSVPPAYARQGVVMQRRPDGLTFLVDGTAIARHAWARPGVREVQLPEHLPPKPQPRHARFEDLGDRVVDSFGELGRSYVDAVERRAPHAPLAILREVCEREAEFGRPTVAAAIESLLQFNVIKRGILSRLCYRFGAVPQVTVTPHRPLPDVTVERRDLATYDGPAA
jgi:transposase